MFHPRFPSILAGVLALYASGCSDRPPAQSKPAVNVILVVVDTLRADYCDPATRKADMPNLFAFEKEAVTFSSAWSPAPMTLPAHTALFSARTPTHTGVTNNGQAVAQELPLLSEWLKKQGYVSQAAVSLATLWPLGLNQGVDRGFEYFDRGSGSISNATDTNRDLNSILDSLLSRAPFFVFAHYAEPHEPYESHGMVQCNADIDWNGKQLESVTTSEWAMRRHDLALAPGVNRLAIRSANDFKVRSLTFDAGGKRLPIQFEVGELLNQAKEFSAIVMNNSGKTQVAHMELWLHDVPTMEELPGRYRREAEASDIAFGNLISMLKKRKLYDSSLIVFTSDHGEALGEHGVVGHVVNLHDEMLHVPLMIKLPKGHDGRRWLEHSQRDLVRLIDVAPTILDALGLQPLPDPEGSSLLAKADRTLLAQTFQPEAPRTLFALRDQRTKLVYDVAADTFRMYDLNADPGELRDIFPKAGKQKTDWQQRLRDLAQTAPTMKAGRVSIDAKMADQLRSLGY